MASLEVVRKSEWYETILRCKGRERCGGAGEVGLRVYPLCVLGCTYTNRLGLYMILNILRAEGIRSAIIETQER